MSSEKNVSNEHLDRLNSNPLATGTNNKENGTDLGSKTNIPESAHVLFEKNANILSSGFERVSVIRMNQENSASLLPCGISQNFSSSQVGSPSSLFVISQTHCDIPINVSPPRTKGFLSQDPTFNESSKQNLTTNDLNFSSFYNQIIQPSHESLENNGSPISDQVDPSSTLFSSHYSKTQRSFVVQDTDNQSTASPNTMNHTSGRNYSQHNNFPSTDDSNNKIAFHRDDIVNYNHLYVGHLHSSPNKNSSLSTNHTNKVYISGEHNNSNSSLHNYGNNRLQLIDEVKRRTVFDLIPHHSAASSSMVSHHQNLRQTMPLLSENSLLPTNPNQQQQLRKSREIESELMNENERLWEENRHLQEKLRELIQSESDLIKEVERSRDLERIRLQLSDQNNGMRVGTTSENKNYSNFNSDSSADGIDITHDINSSTEHEITFPTLTGKQLNKNNVDLYSENQGFNDVKSVRIAGSIKQHGLKQPRKILRSSEVNHHHIDFDNTTLKTSNKHVLPNFRCLRRKQPIFLNLNVQGHNKMHKKYISRLQSRRKSILHRNLLKEASNLTHLTNIRSYEGVLPNYLHIYNDSNGNKIVTDDRDHSCWLISSPRTYDWSLSKGLFQPLDNPLVIEGIYILRKRLNLKNSIEDNDDFTSSSNDEGIEENVDSKTTIDTPQISRDSLKLILKQHSNFESLPENELNDKIDLILHYYHQKQIEVKKQDDFNECKTLSHSNELWPPLPGKSLAAELIPNRPSHFQNISSSDWTNESDNDDDGDDDDTQFGSSTRKVREEKLRLKKNKELLRPLKRLTNSSPVTYNRNFKSSIHFSEINEDNDLGLNFSREANNPAPPPVLPLPRRSVLYSTYASPGMAEKLMQNSAFNNVNNTSNGGFGSSPLNMMNIVDQFDKNSYSKGGGDDDILISVEDENKKRQFRPMEKAWLKRSSKAYNNNMRDHNHSHESVMNLSSSYFNTETPNSFNNSHHQQQRNSRSGVKQPNSLSPHMLHIARSSIRHSEQSSPFTRCSISPSMVDFSDRIVTIHPFETSAGDSQNESTSQYKSRSSILNASNSPRRRRSLLRTSAAVNIAKAACEPSRLRMKRVYLPANFRSAVVANHHASASSHSISGSHHKRQFSTASSLYAGGEQSKRSFAATAIGDATSTVEGSKESSHFLTTNVINSNDTNNNKNNENQSFTEQLNLSNGTVGDVCSILSPSMIPSPPPPNFPCLLPSVAVYHLVTSLASEEFRDGGILLDGGESGSKKKKKSNFKKRMQLLRNTVNDFIIPKFMKENEHLINLKDQCNISDSCYKSSSSFDSASSSDMSAIPFNDPQFTITVSKDSQNLEVCSSENTISHRGVIATLDKNQSNSTLDNNFNDTKLETSLHDNPIKFMSSNQIESSLHTNAYLLTSSSDTKNISNESEIVDAKIGEMTIQDLLNSRNKHVNQNISSLSGFISSTNGFQIERNSNDHGYKFFDEIKSLTNQQPSITSGLNTGRSSMFKERFSASFHLNNLNSNMNNNNLNTLSSGNDLSIRMSFSNSLLNPIPATSHDVMNVHNDGKDMDIVASTAQNVKRRHGNSLSSLQVTSEVSDETALEDTVDLVSTLRAQINLICQKNAKGFKARKNKDKDLEDNFFTVCHILHSCLTYLDASLIPWVKSSILYTATVEDLLVAKTHDCTIFKVAKDSAIARNTILEKEISSLKDENNNFESLISTLEEDNKQLQEKAENTEALVNAMRTQCEYMKGEFLNLLQKMEDLESAERARDDTLHAAVLLSQQPSLHNPFCRSDDDDNNNIMSSLGQDEIFNDDNEGKVYRRQSLTQISNEAFNVGDVINMQPCSIPIDKHNSSEGNLFHETAEQSQLKFFSSNFQNSKPDRDLISDVVNLYPTSLIDFPSSPPSVFNFGSSTSAEKNASTSVDNVQEFIDSASKECRDLRRSSIICIQSLMNIATLIPSLTSSNLTSLDARQHSLDVKQSHLLSGVNDDDVKCDIGILNDTSAAPLSSPIDAFIALQNTNIPSTGDNSSKLYGMDLNVKDRRKSLVQLLNSMSLIGDISLNNKSPSEVAGILSPPVSTIPNQHSDEEDLIHCLENEGILKGQSYTCLSCGSNRMVASKTLVNNNSAELNILFDAAIKNNSSCTDTIIEGGNIQNEKKHMSRMTTTMMKPSFGRSEQPYSNKDSATDWMNSSFVDEITALNVLTALKKSLASDSNNSSANSFVTIAENKRSEFPSIEKENHVTSSPAHHINDDDDCLRDWLHFRNLKRCAVVLKELHCPLQPSSYVPTTTTAQYASLIPQFDSPRSTELLLASSSAVPSFSFNSILAHKSSTSSPLKRIAAMPRSVFNHDLPYCVIQRNELYLPVNSSNRDSPQLNEEVLAKIFLSQLAHPPASPHAAGSTSLSHDPVSQNPAARLIRSPPVSVTSPSLVLNPSPPHAPRGVPLTASPANPFQPTVARTFAERQRNAVARFLPPTRLSDSLVRAATSSSVASFAVGIRVSSSTSSSEAAPNSFPNRTILRKDDNLMSANSNFPQPSPSVSPVSHNLPESPNVNNWKNIKNNRASSSFSPPTQAAYGLVTFRKVPAGKFEITSEKISEFISEKDEVGNISTLSVHPETKFYHPAPVGVVNSNSDFTFFPNLRLDSPQKLCPPLSQQRFTSNSSPEENILLDEARELALTENSTFKIFHSKRKIITPSLKSPLHTSLTGVNSSFIPEIIPDLKENTKSDNFVYDKIFIRSPKLVSKEDYISPSIANPTRSPTKRIKTNKTKKKLPSPEEHSPLKIITRQEISSNLLAQAANSSKTQLDMNRSNSRFSSRMKARSSSPAPPTNSSSPPVTKANNIKNLADPVNHFSSNSKLNKLSSPSKKNDAKTKSKLNAAEKSNSSATLELRSINNYHVKQSPSTALFSVIDSARSEFGRSPDHILNSPQNKSLPLKSHILKFPRDVSERPTLFSVSPARNSKGVNEALLAAMEAAESSQGTGAYGFVRDDVSELSEMNFYQNYNNPQQLHNNFLDTEIDNHPEMFQRVLMQQNLHTMDSVKNSPNKSVVSQNVCFGSASSQHENRNSSPLNQNLSFVAPKTTFCCFPSSAPSQTT